jgi:ferredoxin
MAKIILDNEEPKEIELEDNSEVKHACEELGVEFGCKNGFCRTCEVTVLEGYDNLTPLTENEEFIGLNKPRRLMCQCKIKHGTVKIKIE